MSQACLIVSKTWFETFFLLIKKPKKRPRHREFTLTEGAVSDRFVQLTARSDTRQTTWHPGHGRHRAPKGRLAPLKLTFSYEQTKHYGVPPMSREG